MKEEKLEYNKAFIDLVEKLSPVNHRILITKVGEKAVIRSNNEETNFCYVLEAPLSYISMPTNQIAIIDFTRFKKFYDAMSTKTASPELSIVMDDKNDGVSMIFKNPERSDKLSLSLGDASLPTFMPGFKELAPHTNDVVLRLDEEKINEIQKKISIIGGNYIDIAPADTLLNFFIYTMQSADTAEYPILLETPGAREFKSKYNASIFSLIPKGNYDVEIDGDGCMFFKQVREDEIKLSIMLLSED